MGATFRTFLDERYKKTDATYPLKIRVTVDRRCKEIPLNIYLQKNDWDKKNNRVELKHPNVKLITQKITNTLNDLQEAVLKFETSNTIFTPDDIVQAISKKQTAITITFFSYADQQVETMIKSGRIGNAIAYKNAIAKLLSFTNKKELRFESIDYKLLESFTSSMLSEEIKVNTVAIYMREIRAIYNKAIKEGIVEYKYYPFNKYRIKVSKTISRALTVDEMRKIVQLHLEPNTPAWHSRNYFLLSFCLIGINFTDLFKLTPDSLQNNRIIFSRSKTKKIYSILLQPMAQEILGHYFKPENNPDFLLPVLCKGDSPIVVKKKALQAIKTTNEYLYKIAEGCKIKQNITTYYARYSFANICKSLGYSKDLIAEALGHSYGNSVTGIYLDNYGNEIIDAANAKVIEAVFNN